MCSSGDQTQESSLWAAGQNQHERHTRALLVSKLNVLLLHTYAAGNAGGFLERVSQSLSRLSFQSLPPDHNQAAPGQPLRPAVQQPSAEDVEAGQASQQQHQDQSGKWWWQFWR